MDNKCVATIIVMSYNNEHLLDKTIESIITQTYDDIEIIISDDCSIGYNKSMMKDMVKRCHQKTSKIILNHNTKNIGTVKHFNKLIKMTTGDYIFPLSCGDEFFSNNIVADVVRSFNESNDLVITGCRLGLKDTGSIILPYERQRKILKNNIDEKFQHITKYADLISGACTYYSKKVFELFGLFDEQYVLLEDCPYYIKLLENNVDIRFIDEIFIRYDMNGVSTGKMHPLLRNDMDRMFENLSKDKNLSFTSRRIVKYRVQKSRTKSKIVESLKIILYLDVIILLAYNQLCKKI